MKIISNIEKKIIGGLVIKYFTYNAFKYYKLYTK